jgi:hypothetical protein
MRRSILLVLLLIPSALFAGKPWRPEAKTLMTESDLVVVGKVISLEPSLVKNEKGEACAIGEVQVEQTLKGDAPKTVRVAVVAEPVYDEKGMPIARSTAFRYELKRDDHRYLLYLKKVEAYYVPAHFGSGIVDLNRDRPGDGPAELEKAMQAR